MRAAVWPILASILLTGAAAGYLRLAGPRTPAGAPERTHLTIGNDKFDFDSRYVEPQRDDGVVELAAFFPDFGPAATTDDISAHTDLDERFQRLVFVELKPADEKLDPVERTERLYLRFLSETSWSHPGGLVAREFEPGSPFEGDELFFVPPTGRQFSARCHRSDPSRNLPNTCIAVIRGGAVDAQIRFPADLLSQWEAVSKGVRGLIEAARR